MESGPHGRSSRIRGRFGGVSARPDNGREMSDNKHRPQTAEGAGFQSMVQKSPFA